MDTPFRRALGSGLGFCVSPVLSADDTGSLANALETLVLRQRFLLILFLLYPQSTQKVNPYFLKNRITAAIPHAVRYFRCIFVRIQKPHFAQTRIGRISNYRQLGCGFYPVIRRFAAGRRIPLRLSVCICGEQLCLKIPHIGRFRENQHHRFFSRFRTVPIKQQRICRCASPRAV